MKNAKGITLIALVIMIIVLGILASIATYSGISVVKSSKFTKFSTELKIMQSQINNIYEKYKNNETIKIDGTTYYGETDKGASDKKTIFNIGEDVTTADASIKSQADRVFKDNASGITDQAGYKYWSKELIKKLGIEQVEQDFFVNLEKRSVVSYEGFEYEGKTYYTLDQIPNGLYNVDYTAPNIEDNKPTFESDYTVIGENKFKIDISNIQYGGYIDKWQVKYQLEGQDYWNTSDDLSFTVDADGTYKIKIVNGNAESMEQSLYLGYIKDNLVLYYDSINHTGNGDYKNDTTTTTWKDLSGNNHDGTINGTLEWSNNRAVFNGVNTSIDTNVHQGDFGQSITIQTIVTFQEFGKYRGLYGYHVGSTYQGIYNQSGSPDNTGFNMMTDNNSGIGIGISSEKLLNKETHITVVMQGGSGMKVYLNGELEESKDTTYNIVPRDDYNFFIGQSFPATDRYFKGTMANFKVYSKALTDLEIQSNYKIDKQRFNLQS